MEQTSYGTITITDTTDIDRIENWYLATSASSGVTTSTTGWTTTVQSMTSTKQYLWNYEKILGTGDVVINTTDPVIIGRYGQNGGTGAAGKGISSIVEYYNTTTTAVKPTSTSGFTTEVKQVDSTNRYLWNYEVINYTEGNPTTTDIRLIGVYGDPGNDAYTVILDNDSHTFSAGTSAAIATNITVKVIAYKGTTQMVATIGTISGQVTGLTTSLVSNSSVNAGFKVTVTTSLTTKSGVLTIPITVDGKSFIRKFSWSLALTGQTGTSVSSTVKYYQLATSKPSQPSNNAAIPSGWGTNEPTFDSSKLTYTLYTVIQTTYSNGNIVYSAVQVDSAFEAAKVAYQKAQAAQTNAGVALTSANGKNTIYYQTSQPTGGTYKTGDTWFDTDDGNKIYNWNTTTSKWVPAQLGTNAIADLAITNAKVSNLDAGSITAGDISADRMKVNSIQAVNNNTGTVKIKASKVEIDGTAVFNSISSKVDDAITNKGYATTIQAQGYANEAVNNLEIGGRNLLQKSNDGNTYTWSQNGGATTKTVNDSGATFTITTLPNSGSWGVFQTTDVYLRKNIEPDTYYTLSFDIMVTESVTGGINFNIRAGNGSGPYLQEINTGKIPTVLNTWEHIVITNKSLTTLPEETGKFLYISMGALATKLGSFSIKNIKVEKGNKATAWSPAPEDINDSAVAKTQRIYYRSSSSTKPTAYPTAWVAEEGNKWNSNATTAAGWSRKVTPISNGTGANVTKYLYLWTATQKQMVNGDVATLTADDIALDDSTTVIDGGKIITGSVKANQIDANAVTAEKIHAEAVTLGKLGSDVTNSINNAGKTASNYIVADSTGLMVADMSSGAQTPNTATTKNVFIDSDSVDIRNGQTTLASFFANKIELGKNSVQSTISLCNGEAEIGYNSIGNCMEIRSNNENSDIVFCSQDKENIIGVRNVNQKVAGVFISSSLGTDIYGSNMIKLTVGDATTRYYSSIDVQADSGIYIDSSQITLNDNFLDVSETFGMESIINAIPVTLYDNASASASSSATLSETAENFKRMTIFFKDSDGNYSSVDVWSPNGKRVSLSLTWINGASTQEMYQRVRWVTISGTTISTYKASSDSKYRTGQVKLGATASVTNSDYISIVHVIGYR